MAYGGGFSSAYRNMVNDPRALGQPPFVPQRPGGFQPPSIAGPVGMGGGMPMGGAMPTAGGGGFMGDMSGFEKAYLLTAGLGGLGNWWERRQDRQEDKRRYDEQTELERQHRRKMGLSWQDAYGP